MPQKKWQKSCGFALTWDNTQINVHVRNQSMTAQNRMLLWANAYAAKNRVDPRRLEDIDSCLKASDVLLANFGDVFRERMKTMVSRVLITHIPSLAKNYRQFVSWHIPHEYADQLSQKSDLVR